MLSKRSLGCDLADVAPNKRLKLNLADFFLSNAVSARRAASLFADADLSGAAGVRHLTRLGDEKHVHRNLLRKLLKNCKWPKPYYADVRVWNAKTELEETASIPLLLLHELVHALRQSCLNVQTFYSRDGMDGVTAGHLASAIQELGLDDNVVGLGPPIC